jgi:hypothetical protein
LLVRVAGEAEDEGYRHRGESALERTAVLGSSRDILAEVVVAISLKKSILTLLHAMRRPGDGFENYSASPVESHHDEQLGLQIFLILLMSTINMLTRQNFLMYRNVYKTTFGCYHDSEYHPKKGYRIQNNFLFLFIYLFT